MDAEKMAMMVEYLRVLADLKNADVFCNTEIKTVLEKMTEELEK